MLTIFLPMHVYGNFSRGARTANSADHVLILPNFEPIHYVIAELVTCKNEDDPIKKDDTIVITTLFIDFSDNQGQLTL